MPAFLTDSLAAGETTACTRAELHGLMEEAWSGARACGAPVVVLAIEVKGLEALEERLPGRGVRVAQAVARLLTETPRTGDLFVQLDGLQLLAMYPGMPHDATQLLCGLVFEGVKALEVPGFKKLVRARLAVGIAHDRPKMELELEAALEVAREGIAVACSRSASCCVHTELYDLCTRRIARRREMRLERIFLRAQSSKDKRRRKQALAWDEERKAAADPRTEMQRELQRMVDAQKAREEAGAERARPKPAPAAADDEAPELAAPARPTPAPAASAGASTEVWTEDQLDAAIEKRMAEHRTRTELLERRIAKLVHSLEETESELARVMQMKGVDPGVASVFRTVQGLDAGEDHYGLKLALMERLLEANLDLRKQIGDGQSSVA